MIGREEWEIGDGSDGEELSHLEVLDPTDRTNYDRLGRTLASMMAAPRHSGIDSFTKQLTMVHSFAKARPETSAQRQMACGVFFGPGYILINTSRLKDLLKRSKSGLNLCLQRLGYGGMRPSNDLVRLFVRLIPGISEGVMQVRNWAVRTEPATSTLRLESLIPGEAAADFERKRLRSSAVSAQAAKPLPVLEWSTTPLIPSLEQVWRNPGRCALLEEGAPLWDLTRLLNRRPVGQLSYA